MPKFSVPRHLWRAIYPVLIFFGIQFAVIFLIQFLAMTVYVYEGLLSSRVDVSGLFSGDPDAFADVINNAGLQWFFDNLMWVQLAISAAATAVLLPIWRYAKSKPPAYHGGRLDLKAVLLLIGAGIGANYLVSTVIGLFNLVEFFPDYAEVETLLYGGSLLSRILAVGFVGPVAEEICVRGIVQKRLNEWIPTKYAVFFSALVFGVLHMNVLQGAYAVVFGVLLSLVYLKFRTLWAPIIGHIAVNLSSILFGALVDSLPGEIPVLLDMLIVLVLIAIGLFCAVAIKNRPDGDGDALERGLFRRLYEMLETEPVRRLYEVTEINEANREEVTSFIKAHWFSTELLIRGRIIDMTGVDGFVIFGPDDRKRNIIKGLITYIITGESGYQSGTVCEITSLDSTPSGRGVGTLLLDRVKEAAAERGCRRLQLITSNDNVNAIGFYQKYGFDMTGVNLGAIDRERELKPEIPLKADNGIPIRHEIEFAMEL